MFLVYCCFVHPHNGFLERVNPGKNCTIGFILFTLFFFFFFLNFIFENCFIVESRIFMYLLRDL